MIATKAISIRSCCCLGLVHTHDLTSYQAFLCPTTSLPPLLSVVTSHRPRPRHLQWLRSLTHHPFPEISSNGKSGVTVSVVHLVIIPPFRRTSPLVRLSRSVVLATHIPDIVCSSSALYLTGRSTAFSACRFVRDLSLASSTCPLTWIQTYIATIFQTTNYP